MLHMLFTIVLWVSMYFMRLSHPISMGVVLILHTFIVGVATGVMADNFIYSYILFLVILGGVLVLFIYMTSLVSNEMFYFSWVDVMLAMVVLVLGGMFVLFIMAPLGSLLVNLELLPPSICGETLMVGLEKLYSNYTFLLTLFLIIYLLYVLLVCVSIVGVKTGPLRKFN
nr:NADH dehydrogenase subunit 6 [Cloeon dipterum]